MSFIEQKHDSMKVRCHECESLKMRSHSSIVKHNLMNMKCYSQSLIVKLELMNVRCHSLIMKRELSNIRGTDSTFVCTNRGTGSTFCRTEPKLKIGKNQHFLAFFGIGSLNKKVSK